MNTFTNHKIVRSEVLEQILSRVVTRSESSSVYNKLLAQIGEESQQLLLEYLPKLKEAIDYLSYMPTTSAEGLLSAGTMLHLQFSYLKSNLS